MKKGYLIAAVLFAALAGFVIWECSSFPPGRARVPGPAIFPTAIALLMLLSAISLAISALRMSPAENKVIGIFSDNNKRVYVTMALLVLYVVLMYFVGFCTTSVAMLFGFITWFGKYKPHIAAVYAVAIVGIIYVVFNYVLLVPFRFGVFL